jgi:hypothetical protein
MEIKTKVSIGHAMLPAPELDNVTKVVGMLEDKMLEAKVDESGVAAYAAPA